jgi:hypothetical protein
VNVRNALINALAREGVQVTPDKMDAALVWLAEGDARPDHLPESIVFGGITLAWPRGRETRVPTANERAAYNKALKHLHTSEDANERLTDEDNVRVYREVYSAFVNRLKIEPSMALPVLTAQEIEQARVLVEAETTVVEQPPVIEHNVPTDVQVNVLDGLLSDLAALTATLG